MRLPIADLSKDVWLFGDWAKAHPEFDINAKDTSIGLVAIHGVAR